ncbi:hypothetical protein J3R82DRAFT_3994 [Butyriboletus roseoflavus]|nr:hypothetical protein J3R82DRAFT_3994 [Butyriboletus roseoflavus]
MPDDTSRSLSGDPDLDSDNDTQSYVEQDTRSLGPGKPGRKKNPNSQAARRDQNRIAQREFRLRKQQRIRDLEARVELLSGSQDEAFTDLRAMLKDLMAENLTLRNLLKSVSGFIAEGGGGMIQKLGFEMHEWTSVPRQGGDRHRLGELSVAEALPKDNAIVKCNVVDVGSTI